MKRDARPGAALLVVLSLVSSCSGGDEDAAGPEAAPAAPAHDPAAGSVPLRYNFTDATVAAGLDGFRQVNGNLEKHYILEGVGGGVALFDYDADGDLDAYLTNGSSLAGFPEGEEPRDALYRNDGTGRFEDVTAAAGLGDTAWTIGVAVADVDADGLPDLYLTNWGPNVLLRNRGDGTFEDVTERSGLGDPSWSACANFFDFDRDGDLDLYVTNYIEFDAEEMIAARPTMNYRGITVYRGPRGLPAAPDSFYVNDGTGRFEDRSEAVGVHTPLAFGFQSVVFDYDRDGWLDVFVANDSQANFLWRNTGEGRFEDVALVTGTAVNMFGKEQSGMGVAVGDLDGDLRTDLYVTHFAFDYSTLYRGVEPSAYVDASHRLHLVDETELDVSWGCGFHDFDSDGDLEIYAVNGHIYPQVDRVDAGVSYAQKNDFFEREGRSFRAPPGGAGPGFEVVKVSRGSAVGDVDGDGDLDILVSNLDDTPTLLRNDGPQRNWAKLLLAGPPGNTGAVGARLVATVGETQHLRLVGTCGSFLSCDDPRVHVGLGDAEQIDRVDVTWPDGTEQTFRDLPAGETSVLRRE